VWDEKKKSRTTSAAGRERERFPWRARQSLSKKGGVLNTRGRSKKVSFTLQKGGKKLSSDGWQGKRMGRPVLNGEGKKRGRYVPC